MKKITYILLVQLTLAGYTVNEKEYEVDKCKFNT